LRETLLIVDYRKNLRVLYSHELHEEGYRVLLADNEDEATNILESECPDLIILDGKLLLLEGTKPLENFKNACSNTLIIINDVDYKSCEKLLSSSPVDGCIVKSSDLDDLKEKINEMFDKK